MQGENYKVLLGRMGIKEGVAPEKILGLQLDN